MLARLNHPNALRFWGAIVASAEDAAFVSMMTEHMRRDSPAHFRITCARAALCSGAPEGM